MDRPCIKDEIRKQVASGIHERGSVAGRSRRSLSVCSCSFFSETLGSFAALRLVNYLSGIS